MGHRHLPSIAVAITAVLAASSAGSADSARMERFRTVGAAAAEAEPALRRAGAKEGTRRSRATEAPTGFDNRTNGFLPQGPRYETITEDNVVPRRSFNDNRFIFEEVEVLEDGLGPTYNAQSCRECHQNVVTGGASQVAEHRTGRMDGQVFFESLGGSLVQSRATHPEIVERVAFEDTIRTFRISTNTLGAGYVEAIANSTLLAIRDAQPPALRGTALEVPVLEAGSLARIGRFGWKSQHASLESFSADAYLNEMGITSPLFPEENSSSGEYIGFGTGYDRVADPEDDGVDIVAFADFMRSTKAPSRGRITANVRAGEQVFGRIGCASCHTPSITMAPAGTPINGDAYRVPRALGDKVIHPYSDFLLHDIGTGDGIPFLPTPEFASTASQIRTAPLSTTEEAIERHAGQATAVTAAFRALSARDQALLLEFLDSL